MYAVAMNLTDLNTIIITATILPLAILTTLAVLGASASELRARRAVRKQHVLIAAQETDARRLACLLAHPSSAAKSGNGKGYCRSFHSIEQVQVGGFDSLKNAG